MPRAGWGKKHWDYRDKAAFSFLTGPKVLDAGCSEGITLEKLMRIYPEAEGCDIDDLNVSICRQFNLPVRKASIYQLPYGEGEFDSCIFAEVIEHLEYPRKALENLARVIKPAGTLVIIYPVDWAFFVARLITLRIKEARFDPGHLRQWKYRELQKLLTSVGFRPVAFRALPFLWPFMLHGIVVGQRIADCGG